jgi:hypothetical protein
VAAAGYADKRRTGGYRKRKPLPALIIIAVLIIAAVVVWIKVVHRASDTTAVTACPPSSAQPVAATGQPAPQPGTALAHDALSKVTPAPPTDVQVQVLNASSERGEAQQVTTELNQLGFKQAGDPADDPLYPALNMKCVGQIRFGANGTAAARTLSMVLPCTQLVRDNRQDATVDLAIGTNFGTVAPTRDAVQALQQLDKWAATHPEQQGGQQAEGGQQPQVDQALVTGATSISCA